jgi:hypothetical protein
VKEVSQSGSTIKVFEQNVGGIRSVMVTKLYLPELSQGWIRVYRPVAGEE